MKKAISLVISALLINLPVYLNAISHNGCNIGDSPEIKGYAWHGDENDYRGMFIKLVLTDIGAKDAPKLARIFEDLEDIELYEHSIIGEKDVGMLFTKNIKMCKVYFSQDKETESGMLYPNEVAELLENRIDSYIEEWEAVARSPIRAQYRSDLETKLLNKHFVAQKVHSYTFTLKGLLLAKLFSERVKTDTEVDIACKEPEADEEVWKQVCTDRKTEVFEGLMEEIDSKEEYSWIKE
ncbi:hypothetical protein ACFL6Y_06410 [Elusimicrobiota bacterium]